MKTKTIIIILSSLIIVGLLFSCGSAPEPTQPDAESPQERPGPGPKEGGPGETLRQWVEALHDQDEQVYMESYWPDARKEMELVSGPVILEGREEILENQRQIWNMPGWRSPNYGEPEVERLGPMEVIFHFIEIPGTAFHEHFVFTQRDGQWKIQEQFIAPHWHMIVRSEFQQWADENDSGFLEKNEEEIFGQAAAELIMAPHRNISPLDSFFDFDENGSIDIEEIKIIRLYFFGAGLKRLIETAPEHTWELLDLNRDGSVDEFERKTAAEFTARFNQFDLQIRPAETPFDKAADMDGDGRLAKHEQIEMFYRIYHPITYIVHNQEMIGNFTERLAGRTDDGATTSEKEEAEIAVELEESVVVKPTTVVSTSKNLSGKTIAVVGVDNLHSSISDETIQGLLLFIENSFVNTGQLRVIDRQNIQKITEEYKFQSTSLTDEDTAVEIGKLANADYIATGALSKVGEKYYLNVKMIDVKTGEIAGSSIADASVEDVFYDMVNTAVDRIMSK